MKKNYTTDELLSYLEGRLSAEAQHQLEAALNASSELRRELEQLQATQHLLQATASDAAKDVLSPFFTDRLMKQLSPQPGTGAFSLEEELAMLLGRLFRPVAIAGLVLAICLAVYNINLANDYNANPSTAESILAMPPLTSSAIYELDYYASQEMTLEITPEMTP